MNIHLFLVKNAELLNLNEGKNNSGRPTVLKKYTENTSISSHA